MGDSVTKIPQLDEVRTQVVKAAGDRKVQLIAGAALIGLAVGLFLGIKIKGPRDWVPPVDRKPEPCGPCEEKRLADLVVGSQQLATYLQGSTAFHVPADADPPVEIVPDVVVIPPTEEVADGNDG